MIDYEKSAFLIAALCLVGSAHAAGFAPGNILVSESVFSTGPQKVSEYTRTGTLVRSITIPTLSGQDIFDNPRGMVVDKYGNLHVFNGSETIGISNYNPVTNTWTSTMMPDISIIPNATFGKIATFGDFVYLPKHGSSGIVRYNVVTNTSTTFGGLADDPIDFSIGADGLLYALEGSGDPSGDSIQILDPTTMAVTRSISLNPIAFSMDGGLVRDISVRSDGKMWLSQLNGPSYLIDSNGNLLGTYATAHSDYVQDADMASDGAYAQFNENGRVYLFDQNLNYIRDFDGAPNGSDNTFGTFVPSSVPEPATASILLLSLGGYFTRKRGKKACR